MVQISLKYFPNVNFSFNSLNTYWVLTIKMWNKCWQIQWICMLSHQKCITEHLLNTRHSGSGLSSILALILMKHLLVTSHLCLQHEMKVDVKYVWLQASLVSQQQRLCLWHRNRRCGFNPWVRKIPWRRTWQPTPVFLPGESHRQRSLASLLSSGHNESDTTATT